jgi:hypothetical protein
VADQIKIRAIPALKITLDAPAATKEADFPVVGEIRARA